jgi:hypothetical protein
MRRLFLSLLGLAWLGLAGCHHNCSHGVCDCEFDDQCFMRAPWANHSGHYGAPTPDVLGAPTAPFDGAPSGPAMPPATEKLKTMPEKL